MSNYTKATNFAIKDGLTTTDPAKVIKGTEIDNEYNAISSAISSKADVNSPSLTGTPTAPTATAGTNTTQIATTAFVLANGIPSGSIVMWSGSIGSIPTGWLLCNGSSGTPDLRDRFIVGAGSTYAVAATGGNANATLVSHSHTANSSVSDPQHSHNTFGQYGGGGNPGGSLNAQNPGGRNEPTTSSSTGITVATSISTEGSSATNANLPPYYALAYIMKA